MAWFIANTNTELYSAGRDGSVSLWNLTISCSFSDGITSQGSRKPSMVPLLTASGIAGSGMPTGLAPSAASSLLVWRVGARIFRPLKSASVFTGLPLVCT